MYVNNSVIYRFHFICVNSQECDGWTSNRYISDLWGITSLSFLMVVALFYILINRRLQRLLSPQRPCQHLLFLDFWITDIVSGVKWNLCVVFICASLIQRTWAFCFFHVCWTFVFHSLKILCWCALPISKLLFSF